MQEQVLVLSATIYNFADEKTGEIRKGVTVYCVHLSGAGGIDGNTIGVKPSKYSLSIDFKDTFAMQTLPAVATMDLTIDFNRMRPIPLKFTDFKVLDLDKLGREAVGSKG